MTLTDILILIASVIIIGAAVVYIILAKRSGKKCIGCPDAKSCSHEKVGSYSCRGNCSSCTACRESAPRSEENRG